MRNSVTCALRCMSYPLGSLFKKVSSVKLINEAEFLKKMRFKIWALLVLAILVWWHFLRTEQGFIEEPLPSENGSITVFFCPQDHCEQALLNVLGGASSIQCALYSLKLPTVTKVLKEKSTELLIDEDNYEGWGKKIVMSGLMHDKFCVLNHQSIWTGSFNPTKNGAYGENNNLVIVESKTLAENYAAKFQDIKAGKHTKVRHPKLYLNGFLVENYFCPEDGCEGHVLSALKQAKHAVYFLTYSFTSDQIGNFLVENKGRLDIQGVMEKSQASKYSEFFKFNASNMKVRLDKNKFNLHHKVFIIDNETVITGSYNPTVGGDEKNRENVLIIHDSNIARQFVDEFERIWKES